MEIFGPIRSLILGNLPALRWLVPALTLFAIAALFAWKRKDGLAPAALVLAFGLAGWGQVFIGSQSWVPGLVLYGAGAVALLLWLLLLRGEGGFDLPQPGVVARRSEIALFLLVILVAAFARFYRFDQVPYGIEGDESKWSVQTAAQMFAHETRWDSDYRYQYVPYTYYVEGFFYRTLGISIHTARFQVALLSVIATALFYFLARRILGPPGALIATFLLAVSIPDISASRLSHVESQVKLPVILSFLGLVYAATTQRWYWYLVTGLAIAAGLLVFDTFFMVPVVVGLWLGWRLLIDRRVRWVPGSSDWLGKIGRLVLFAVPILPVAHGAIFYITTRRGDHNKSGASLLSGGAHGLAQMWPQLRDNFGQTIVNFSYQRWGDFLMNRDGPIFNALLIPLAAIGLIYLVVRWRRGQNGLVPLWFLLLFFPAAILFGSPYVRVFYPSFPAFYLLAAAAIVLLYRTVYRLVGSQAEGSAAPSYAAGTPGGTEDGQKAQRYVGRTRAGLIAALVVGLLLVGANNIYVYLHETKDFPDRIARRELSDAASKHLARGQMLYVPYMPLYDDFVEWEREFLQYVAWGTAPVGQDGQYYRLLPYDELLRSLSAEGAGLSGATVLYDRGNDTLKAERQAIVEAVERCYPGVTVDTIDRFDALVIPDSALKSPACTANVAVTAQPPARAGSLTDPAAGSGGELAQGESLVLGWKTNPPDAGSAARVEIARQPPGTLWLEAEDLFNSPSWYVEGRFAPHFSGRGYLGDWFDAQDVTADVQLPQAGRYTVWVRTHRRVTQDMPLTVSVAGHPFPAALHTPEQFDQWLWERLGDLDLPAGPVPVTLHRDYHGDRHMSVFIDALVFSVDPGYDPAGGQWPIFYQSPVVQTRAGHFDLLSQAGAGSDVTIPPGSRQWRVQVIVGDRLVDGVLSLEDPAVDLSKQDLWRVLSTPPAPAAAQMILPAGEYRWRVQVLDGDRIIGAAGDVGQWSSWVNFTIQ